MSCHKGKLSNFDVVVVVVVVVAAAAAAFAAVVVVVVVVFVFLSLSLCCIQCFVTMDYASWLDGFILDH